MKAVTPVESLPHLPSPAPCGYCPFPVYIFLSLMDGWASGLGVEMILPEKLVSVTAN